MADKIEEMVNKSTSKNRERVYTGLGLLALTISAGVVGYRINEYFSSQRGAEKRNNVVQVEIDNKPISNNVASYKSVEEYDEGENKKINDESLEEKADAAAIKYLDTFVYIYDENSKSGELRIKLGKLSEEERALYISMKGTEYNKKNDYISFNHDFEDKEFYQSMKGMAILSQFHEKDNISDKEKEFIYENAPDAHRALFPFDNRYDKKEMKKEIKEERKPEKYPILESFLGIGVEVWLRSMAAEQDKRNLKALFGKDMNITTEDMIKARLDAEARVREEKIKKKSYDEVPKAPLNRDTNDVAPAPDEDPATRQKRSYIKKLYPENAPPAPR